jgi:hypothetical protein
MITSPSRLQIKMPVTVIGRVWIAAHAGLLVIVARFTRMVTKPRFPKRSPPAGQHLLMSCQLPHALLQTVRRPVRRKVADEALEFFNRSKAEFSTTTQRR